MTPEAVGPGTPSPLGPRSVPGGVRFAVVSTAPEVRLVLDPLSEGRREIELEAERHRTGDVWHLEIEGLRAPVSFAWRVRRPSGSWSEDLLDPRASDVGGRTEWGRGTPAARREWISVHPGSGSDRSRPPGPTIHPCDRVIYELSVRGFTADPSSGVEHPGTCRGLVEKIDHLRELGVTTVELLPLFAWNELEIDRRNPETGEPLRNLWGYSPVSFFAPHPGLCRSPGPATIEEVKEMVDGLHGAGIEVFLDVVYNHSGEKDLGSADPRYSLAALAPELYYRFDSRGRPVDVTGCGNTLDTSRPTVRDLILDSLRHWAGEGGFDGFRFDLAAALTRGEDGEPEGAPELIRRISEEPLLAERALIAEPWDAGGCYRLGSFPGWGAWSEWNDRFRDTVRRFVRGDGGRTRELALRLAGSPDLYRESPLGPGSSINYVTCHDGFTLRDLVSYAEKRNRANGEGNRDGTDTSWSWNCGREGPSEDPAVVGLRRRQVRNLLTTLFLAQGVPMILGGDELGNSQDGNNNAYCQDNPVGWIQWAPLSDPELSEFVRSLIDLRRSRPTLRRRSFPEGPIDAPESPFRWHGERLGRPDWGPRARRLALELLPRGAPAPDHPLFAAWNPTPEPARFQLPEGRWVSVVDTFRGLAGSEGAGAGTTGSCGLEPYSCRVLLGERAP